MTDQSNSIKSLAELVRKLHDDTNKIKWPLEQMTEISNRLAVNSEILANPERQKESSFTQPENWPGSLQDSQH